jgi:hypothetical protein
LEGVFWEEKCRKKWHFLRPISKMPRRPKLVSNQQPEAQLWVLNGTFMFYEQEKSASNKTKQGLLSTWC